jgi:hypothetical protein
MRFHAPVFSRAWLRRSFLRKFSAPYATQMIFDRLAQAFRKVAVALFDCPAALINIKSLTGQAV